MDHLIGQRFNLISKSEIRYLGTLHQINPDDATIALEDVYSFGTEDREAPSFIPPSQHKFDYIVFRGGDVKDIRVAEDQKEKQQPSPQNVPDDPAILNSSRPGPPPSQQGPPPRDQSPFPPPGYPRPPPFGGFYPHQQYDRGFGPPPPGAFGPGPGFPQNMPYGPPPPGYFGPPGQGIPQGPNQFQPPPPIGPPGQRPGPPPNQQPQQQPPSRPSQPQAPKPTSELPVDNKSVTNSSSQAPPAALPVQVPSPTSESKPSVPPVNASVSSTSGVPSATPSAPSTTAKAPPIGPKSTRVTPAVPMTVNQKTFTPPVPTATNGPLSSAPSNAPASAKPMSTQAAMDAASKQAKDAVATALAKLNPTAAAAAPKPVSTAAAVDALTRKVNEMKTNDAAGRGRGSYRGGRGNFQRNGSGGNQSRKIEIPKSDYDFESANAKFNKDDLVKEAIATDSPIGETLEGSTNGIDENDASMNGEKRKDSLSVGADKAYDKKSSFFDNISSEARDREERMENNGRPVRGEEYKKNIETFGQGNVDGGYRGRGRGGFGRGRQYGGNRGYRGGYAGRGGNTFGGYRGRGRGDSEAAQTTS